MHRALPCAASLCACSAAAAVRSPGCSSEFCCNFRSRPAKTKLEIFLSSFVSVNGVFFVFVFFLIVGRYYFFYRFTFCASTTTTVLYASKYSYKYWRDAGHNTRNTMVECIVFCVSLGPKDLTFVTASSPTHCIITNVQPLVPARLTQNIVLKPLSVGSIYCGYRCDSSPHRDAVCLLSFNRVTCDRCSAAPAYRPGSCSGPSVPCAEAGGKRWTTCRAPLHAGSWP